jgi:methanethiol S-methyltransferase
MRSRPSPPVALIAWTGAGLFVGSLLYTLYSYQVRFVAGGTGASWLQPLAVNIALFTVFAVHHSVLARSALKQRVVARVGLALERPLYVWIASLLLVLCCAYWHLLPGRAYAWPDRWALIPRGLQVLGGVITLLAARKLDVLELAGVRTRRANAPRHPLETHGLYALVRHPIYLGWVLLVLGAPDMTWTRASFAALSIVYLAVAVPYEERDLVAVYGQAYRAYQRRVPWRFVPRVY